MRIMECTVRVVESLQRYNEKLMQKVRENQIVTPVTGLTMTPDTFSKIFSPERIRLLQRIYRNNIRNIYQLAKEMHKPYEVVFRNIKYLEGLGLVKIRDKEGKKIPSVDCRLRIELFAD
jgi:predicted transcriptional regulator